MYDTRIVTRSIGTFVALLALLSTAAVLSSRSATPAAAAESGEVLPSDKWLEGLTAPNKQLFDSPAPGGGIPLVHIMNYYDTYNRAYRVADRDIDAVGTFYGATTFYGLNDAMWAKYRLGEFLETVDPATGKPAIANPWRRAPMILGMPLPPASLEALQKRGVTFIVCDNAMQIFAGMLAKARGLETDVVYQDLKANILPGVELVPAMVIAIEQAKKAGLSYHRQ